MAAQDPRVAMMMHNYGSAEDAILSLLQEKDRLEKELNEALTVNAAFTNNTQHMITLVNANEKTMLYQRHVIASLQTELDRQKELLAREKRLSDVFKKPSSAPVKVISPSVVHV
jgi:hypothetical protein